MFKIHLKIEFAHMPSMSELKNFRIALTEKRCPKNYAAGCRSNGKSVLAILQLKTCEFGRRRPPLSVALFISFCLRMQFNVINVHSFITHYCNALYTVNSIHM